MPGSGHARTVHPVQFVIVFIFFIVMAFSDAPLPERRGVREGPPILVTGVLQRIQSDKLSGRVY